MQLDDSLGFLLNQAAGEMKYALEARLRPFGLTPAQWSALVRLAQEDGRPINELGASLYFDRPTISGVIRRLEEKSLIRREKASVDQRIFNIYITPAGQDVLAQVSQFPETINATALKDFTQAEAEMFKHLVRRVLQNMG